MREAVPTPATGTRSYRWLAAPIVAFALVSLTAGLLAHHDPQSKGYFQLFFSDPIHLKAGFATAAIVLGCFQLFTAAFAFTLPVAYHCIFKLGFRDPSTRVFAHSLLGCGFYGAFAAKVTIVRLHRFPRLVLPVAGGLLFAVLIGVWYTSALWLYGHDSTPAASGKPAAIPASARPAAGKTVFGNAGCGSCHTLAAARASGQIGPNLDSLRPDFETVRKKVESGGGGMPSFGDRLTEAQIRDVAAFVAGSAGR